MIAVAITTYEIYIGRIEHPNLKSGLYYGKIFAKKEIMTFIVEIDDKAFSFHPLSFNNSEGNPAKHSGIYATYQPKKHFRIKSPDEIFTLVYKKSNVTKTKNLVYSDKQNVENYSWKLNTIKDSRIVDQTLPNTGEILQLVAYPSPKVDEILKQFEKYEDNLDDLNARVNYGLELKQLIESYKKSQPEQSETQDTSQEEDTSRTLTLIEYLQKNYGKIIDKEAKFESNDNWEEKLAELKQKVLETKLNIRSLQNSFVVN